MANNHVASNLLMTVLVVGGFIIGSQVKQEVFPEFELDIVTVSVPYPGASPSEVEQGILLAIEENVRTLEGIEKVTSTAAEGIGSVVVELEAGTDSSKSLADVKSAVDRITSFPEDAERPTVSLASIRREVITVALYGSQSDQVLKEIAERIRQELLLLPDITYVELSGTRPREIAVEVSQAELRRYGLTLPGISDIIRRTALELPAGGVKTSAGEVLLRTAERRDFGEQFRDIPVVAASDGTSVVLSDIASIQDGFEDIDFEARFNEQPAVLINVYRSGDETPIQVSDAVKSYLDETRHLLPPGLETAVLDDRSVMYRERVDLLMRNAQLGLLLVLLTLGLFLNVRLAFWVTLGIPISFLGSLLLLPAMDVSINMISLFAFIITLGIVVDDAIVVGENIFELRERGMSRRQAAIEGVKGIAMPVTFSVLTSVAAFMPLFLVPGTSGKFFGVIPAIVVCVLMISLVESLFVLPAHLGHRGTLMQGLYRFFAFPFSRKARGSVVAANDDDQPSGRESKLMSLLNVPQRKFSRVLERFTQERYMPAVRFATRERYFVIACGIAIFLLVIGIPLSGRLAFTFFPKVDTDSVTARAVLPFGSPFEDTLEVRKALDEAARRTLGELGGDDVYRGIFTLSGARLNTRRGPGPPAGGSGSHLTNVQVFLASSESRGFSATQFARAWREKVKDLPGLESLTFVYSTGPGSEAAIEVQLSHPDIPTLEEAAGRVAEALGAYNGVRDIDDGFAAGKPQLDIRLTEEGESMGLSVRELGRQVRAAFYGDEALRQQRGRDEVRVMVRRPEWERESEYDIENLLVMTTDGGEIPLHRAAEVERGRAYTSISRADGQRVITVKADVTAGANAQKIVRDLKESVLPAIINDYRGMVASFEGDTRRQDESLSSLTRNYVLAAFIIFALLAIPFKSYIQPVVVMSAIPFGVVGAILGHLLMGYDLSLISVFGLVAVSGIVVNDSLVLVHAANEFRARGHSALDAIRLAGARRLRPILLTSLTTFFGLAPMILETSIQARFLIPMAISLGFGVMFATVVILILVPAVYMVVEDLTSLVFGASVDERKDGQAEFVEAQ